MNATPVDPTTISGYLASHLSPEERCDPRGRKALKAIVLYAHLLHASSRVSATDRGGIPLTLANWKQFVEDPSGIVPAVVKEELEGLLPGTLSPLTSLTTRGSFEMLHTEFCYVLLAVCAVCSVMASSGTPGDVHANVGD